MRAKHIRNIAIIAHVDHGKTTIVDLLLKAGGVYRDNQEIEERAMDSMDQERERGITIKAKNTAIHWNDYIINIVDTPGHADFGGEVERVMKMVDGVLLIVDAAEGPQAQTRFVLRKALAQGLSPIVVVNKVDRDHADPLGVHDRTLELFLDLEANEKQFEAPFLYGSAKEGYFVSNLDDSRDGVIPLLETIVNQIEGPEIIKDSPFKMLVSNIDWDDYVGRVAIGKVQAGTIQKGDKIWRIRTDGEVNEVKITKVFEYSGVSGYKDSAIGEPGNIVGVSGFEDVNIGETLSADEETELIDYDKVEKIATENKPKLIIAGGSAYSRIIDFKRFREICDKVGAYLLVDMAHFSGLVAGNAYPNPTKYADVVTSTTHKVLRGPRGGIILTNNEELIKKFNSAIFPGLQGGPLMHVIAAKAVCFKEALSEDFKEYTKNVINNAKILSESLIEKGFNIFSGGTDTHLMLLDLRSFNVTGKDAQASLGRANITCNKNGIPFDTESPMITSGIRLGTPACTTRGFGEQEFKLIAELIHKVIKGLSENKLDNSRIEKEVKKEIIDLCASFPIYDI